MRIFILAGEPSGDRLGAAAMAGLRELRPDVTFDGIGGHAMTAAGLESRFPMSELSVMGLAEVLPRYFGLKRRLNEVIRRVIETRPDILLTIDIPDFGLRAARAVKQAAPEIRCVHYVAPTIWAWRPGRALKLKGVVDQLLALFPFEPPLWEAEGVPCDFVGHPVVAEPPATEAEARLFRTAHGIGDAPMVLALPGSRRGEVERLTVRFGEAIAQVAARRSGLRVVLPAARPVADLVRDLSGSWPVKPILLVPGEDPESQATKRAAFRAADVALAASGTVSLELSAAGTPMVIAYDMAWLSWQVLHRIVRLDTVTLVNIVSESRTVPEFLGPACRPDLIAEGLLRVLAHPEAQQHAMRLTMERLGQGGPAPGLRAAEAILAGWEVDQAARRIQPPPSTRVPSGA
ncbi:lipid-A-disaccharide synthase [Rubellimicrobium rubrum]|uniref:Lipid-A-disaccharide synthase n=1 Tax=Rubellimicrobium rubrum TaxID=2585369 RepID=A0A5C4N1G9_9RHOB|nr:lipid-A-disaccharide synthase [Rubellimicrobium rubrum]TNC51130.1 lipid-A-disaccharide synthase [Rubellimicrobium rubrum]